MRNEGTVVYWGNKILQTLLRRDIVLNTMMERLFVKVVCVFEMNISVVFENI